MSWSGKGRLSARLGNRAFFATLDEVVCLGHGEWFRVQSGIAWWMEVSVYVDGP